MIENALISHKSIYERFCKFQRVASDYKFRGKSLRIKTVTHDLDEHLTQQLGLPLIYPNRSQQKIKTFNGIIKQSPNQQSSSNIIKQKSQSYKIIEKNYEQQLNKFGVNSSFLEKLFSIKCQQAQSKYSQQKYQVFLKNLAVRLCKKKHLAINNMGFGNKSLDYFFQWYTQWDSHITELDLTYACDLLKSSKLQIIKQLLTTDDKLLKLILCNSSLDCDQLKQIFKIINQRKYLFALDITNQNSQNLNRLGDEFSVLQQFFQQNESLTIAKLNNLQLKKEGFQCLCKGISSKIINPLKILAISNNYIIGSLRMCQQFYNLVRSGLTHLDLSSNPLGQDFFNNLPILKSVTIKELNLSQTQMSSLNLYEFLQKIEQCKVLSVLKLDGNDFSHHWFKKIGEKLQINSSIQWLSLNKCQIKTFSPLFHGLIHNKYIKRLDANENCIDCDQETPNKIIECFTYNRDLQELRFRFCNLNKNVIIAIIEGLSKNKRLKLLDVSQNLMDDIAATHILKMVQQNMNIETIGIQKLQLSQHMIKRIHMKLEQNKKSRQKQEFTKLKYLTVEMKAKDPYTWEQLTIYEEEERNLQQSKSKVQEKVDKLQQIVAKKKDIINEQNQKCNDQATRMQNFIKDKLRIQNQKVRFNEKESNRSQKQYQKLLLQKNKQLEEILKLEARIKVVNQHNKQRQIQLEDKLRNQKYLNKRKSKATQLVQLSSRKFSNAHNLPQQKVK